MNASVSALMPRLTTHSLAIVVSLLTYVLTTRVERERRPPSIAIAWVLGLIAIPYLVLPLYILFGRRKLNRRALVPGSFQALGRHWAEDLILSFGLSESAPSSLTMHSDGAASMSALFATIAAARERLDICTYILGNDAVGREVVDALIARVRAGVRVRLMIDGVGAIQLPKHVLRRLHAGGIETAIFCPLFARSTSGPRNLRNHRKMVIADESLLWAGGRNLAAEYFIGVNGEPAWIDLSFDLDGPVAAVAAQQFELDWIASQGKPAAAIEAPRAPPLHEDRHASGRVQFLPSGPDQAEDTVQALLVDACYRSERRILAVTPYFVPDASLSLALRLAARRGVAIDLCLPATSNHILADFARGRALRALGETGAAIHLLPTMVHAKGIVIDEMLAVCGSPNLDSRSLLLNYESAFVLYGSREIDWLAAWIGALVADSVPFDNRPASLWRDVAEGVLLTVAYQL
ncbi:MAG TPA: phospholipase D-like domain-containing protein [Steroidobacteraceae bacterium]|nr:phospholipase D-like domain-containing protein [Steroidobacteraceae bacterium]